MDGRSAASALSVDGFATAIAFDVHLQDRGVMHEAVDSCERHGLVGEDFAPITKRLIGGYQHGSPLVTCGNQLEEHAGFGLILGDVSEVVKDEQIVAIELVDFAFEGQVATGDLELLYEIGCACEQHTPSILDQGKSECCREMALAGAWRAEEENVGTLLQPGITRGQRHDLGLGDHWYGLEVKGHERLAGGQTRLDDMSLQAAASAVGDLVLSKRRQEACCRPTFLIGLLGKLGPSHLDARQTQLAEQKFDTGDVNTVGCRHATTSKLEVGLTA